MGQLELNVWRIGKKMRLDQEAQTRLVPSSMFFD